MMVTETGKRIRKREGQRKAAETQLQAVIRYIRNVTERKKIMGSCQLWMPELPDKVDLLELQSLQREKRKRADRNGERGKGKPGKDFWQNMFLVLWMIHRISVNSHLSIARRQMEICFCVAWQLQVKAHFYRRYYTSLPDNHPERTVSFWYLWITFLSVAFRICQGVLLF